MAERVTQDTASGLQPGMRVLFQGQPHRIVDRVLISGGHPPSKLPYVLLECLNPEAVGCGEDAHPRIGWWRLELP
jgi:hypothetical protein